MIGVHNLKCFFRLPNTRKIYEPATHTKTNENRTQFKSFAHK